MERCEGKEREISKREGRKEGRKRKRKRKRLILISNFFWAPKSVKHTQKKATGHKLKDFKLCCIAGCQQHFPPTAPQKISRSDLRLNIPISALSSCFSCSHSAGEIRRSHKQESSMTAHPVLGNAPAVFNLPVKTQSQCSSFSHLKPWIMILVSRLLLKLQFLMPSSAEISSPQVGLEEVNRRNWT